MFRADVGDAELADQAGFTQLGERAEPLGQRAGAPIERGPDAQVDDVEVVAAELAGSPLPGPATVREWLPAASCRKDPCRGRPWW
jgi:hypothetical protein